MHVAAIFGAVRMANADRTILTALEPEHTAVSRAVMRSADAHEILQQVAPAFGAERYVMDVDPACVAAARHLAAVLVAQ